MLSTAVSLCVRSGLRACAARAGLSILGSTCTRPASGSTVAAASSPSVQTSAQVGSVSGALSSSPPVPLGVVKTFRLRKVRKWSEAAPYIKALEISLDPALDGTAGVKELWRQARGRNVRAANPQYTVGLVTHEGGAPAALKVTYADGRTATLPAQGLSLPDLIDALLEPTEAMRAAEDATELEKN